MREKELWWAGYEAKTESEINTASGGSFIIIEL